SERDSFSCSAGENTAVSAQATNFTTVDWYAEESGGIPLETSTNSYTPTQALPGTNTYYAQARDTRTHFTSTNRTAVRLIISPPLLVNVAPSAQLCPGNAMNLNGVATGGAPPYTYSWSPTTFLDDPAVGSAMAMPPPDTTNLYTLIVAD